MSPTARRNAASVGALALALVAGGVILACANVTLSAGVDERLPRDSGTTLPTDGPTPAPIASPDAREELLCTGYECPAPYASCPDVPALCGVNLLTDARNCGSCGNVCPNDAQLPEQLGGLFACIEGKCAFLCLSPRADCNGSPNDGCEADVLTDEANCGLCGKACPAGVACFDGKCGCPAGRLQCGEGCIDPATDASHCGACNDSCSDMLAGSDPAHWKCGKDVIPPNTVFGCAAAQCGVRCTYGYSDCDDDLCGNGCETRTRSADPNNCGACRVTCAPGVPCVFGKCGCGPDEVLCQSLCHNLQSDPTNCGVCGNRCPGSDNPADHGSPICRQGSCSYACNPGFADCDGKIEDGCEVNLSNDATNCGQCGRECDLGAGQPCVNGQCLTTTCDAGTWPQ